MHGGRAIDRLFGGWPDGQWSPADRQRAGHVEQSREEAFRTAFITAGVARHPLHRAVDQRVRRRPLRRDGGWRGYL